jgi:hypothetical protein
MSSRILLTLSLAASMLIGVASLSADPVDGPKFTTTRVGAHSTDRFNAITFRAGKEADVVIEGDGDTVLHLRVFDQNGNLMDDDTCQYSRCVATWTPKWTGPFYITVENLGGVYNEYSMLAD